MSISEQKPLFQGKIHIIVVCQCQNSSGYTPYAPLWNAFPYAYTYNDEHTTSTEPNKTSLGYNKHFHQVHDIAITKNKVSTCKFPVPKLQCKIPIWQRFRRTDWTNEKLGKSQGAPMWGLSGPLHSTITVVYKQYRLLFWGPSWWNSQKKVSFQPFHPHICQLEWVYLMLPVAS